jgi:hypothetical protein
VTLDFSNLLNPTFNFVLAAEFFCGPYYTLTNLPFLRKTVSVVTSRLRIFIHFSPIVAGVALDVLGNQSAAISSYVPTLADFSSVLRNAVSVTLAIPLII